MRIKKIVAKFKNIISSAPQNVKNQIMRQLTKISKKHIVYTSEKITNRYKDLAPGKSSDADSYHEALTWALKNKQVFNIAIAGPYGSGKSTIIQSYIKKHPELNCINISLANFLSDKQKDENSMQGTEKTHYVYDDNELELGILKQLFYKVNYKRIPQSRYRKLHKVGRLKQFILLVIIAVIILGTFVFCNKKLFSDFIKNISQNWDIDNFIIYGVFITIGLISLLFINQWIFKLRNRINIKELSFDKIGAKNDSQDEKSIFNKNMDEIIYFFEETNYNLLFIEDLDRFDSSDIFVKLRELNTILNNYENIKRKIVFVYAIKDDMFKNDDRTKFFDFIIPVIPIINSTNSGELLLERFKEDKKKNKDIDLDEEFIEFISPYISDMRILNNIYNEFILYKKTIYTSSKNSKKLNLKDKNMFAILVFKNLYPSDFADLQNEEGLVKDIFKHKRDFLLKKQKELEKSKKPIATKLNIAEKEVLRNLKEIKSAMMDFMTNYKGSFIRFIPNYGSSVNYAEIIKDNFDLNELKKTGRVEYYDGRYTNHINFDGQTLFADNNNFPDRFEIAKNKLKEIKNDYLKQLENIEIEIQNLSQLSIKDVFKQYSKEEIFEENAPTNNLLIFLLRNGFIDEGYANYINYFHAKSISPGDMNFILSVRDHQQLSPSYYISNPAKVINRLQEKEFEQPEILNVQLVEELSTHKLKKEYQRKLELIIQQISNGSESSWEFINYCLDKSLVIRSIFDILANSWNGFWDFIYNRNDIKQERKDKFLINIFYESDNSRICSQNSRNNLTKYIEEDPDILNRLFSEQWILKNIIDTCKINFYKLNFDLKSNDILEWIFENGYFVLNMDMIKLASQLKNYDNLDDLITKNYTTIKQLNYQPILKKINEDFDSYLENILLCNDENTEESLESVLEIIDKSNNTDNICEIINKENVKLIDFSMCNFESLYGEEKDNLNSVWSQWIKCNKLAYSWKNLILYWEHFGIDESAISFINSGYKTISEDTDFSYPIDPAITNEIIESKVSDEALNALIQTLPHIDKLNLSNISDSHILILIKHSYFNISQDFVNEFLETHPGIFVHLLIKYSEDIINSIELDCVLDTDDIDEIVLFTELSETAKVFYIENCRKELSDSASQFIRLTKVNISKALFNDVWNNLSEEDKYELLINQISILNNDEIENCFEQLGPEYQNFTKRKYRHKESLVKTDYNLKLVKHLQKVGYITSYTEKVYNVPKGRSLTLLECWIKQIN